MLGLGNIRMPHVVRKGSFMRPVFQPYRGIFVHLPTNPCVQLYMLHIGLQYKRCLIRKSREKSFELQD